MICKCGCETGDHPHLDERECWAEMCRRVEALEQQVAQLETITALLGRPRRVEHYQDCTGWTITLPQDRDDYESLQANNERLAIALAEAEALIAKLERTTLAGGGGSQVEIVEGCSHGWVSDGI